MTTTSTSTVSGISVSLSNQEQWEKFYPHTEMVVTRKTGRLLFPHLKYIVKGLDEETEYSVFLQFERIDDWKYKFSSAGWYKWIQEDKKLPIDMKQHKDGWKCGRDWMDDPLSFKYIKITNNTEAKRENHILLQSMHRYLPVISIQKKGGTEKEEFRLGITEFMAVTTYQNKTMPSLKIEFNHCASGFRQTGGHNKPNIGNKRLSEAPPLSPPPPKPVTPPTVPPTVQLIQPIIPLPPIPQPLPEIKENRIEQQPLKIDISPNMITVQYLSNLLYQQQMMQMNSILINNMVASWLNNQQMPKREDIDNKEVETPNPGFNGSFTSISNYFK